MWSDSTYVNDSFQCQVHWILYFASTIGSLLHVLTKYQSRILNFREFFNQKDVLITEIQQITKRKLIWTAGNSGNFGNGFPIFFANK